MPDIQTNAAPTAARYSDLATVRNRTFDEITVGETACIERTLTQEDIQLFAVLSGDLNPHHIDPAFAASTRFHQLIPTAAVTPAVARERSMKRRIIDCGAVSFIA